MDFTNQPVASIDYSPTAQARNVTLVLEETELANASSHQMERFFRVWCEEDECAPNLTSVTLVLRPSVNKAQEIYMTGIQTFLKCFRNIRVGVPTTIYLDNWSDMYNQVRREYANEPTLILRTHLEKASEKASDTISNERTPRFPNTMR